MHTHQHHHHILRNYIKSISSVGSYATEHSYRIYLQNLLSDIVDTSSYSIRHEPKRIDGVGAPDFEIYSVHSGTRLGFIEAKDLGKNLDELSSSNQVYRYLDCVDNLIFTDYIRFMLLRLDDRYRVQILKDVRLCESTLKIPSRIDLEHKTRSLLYLVSSFLEHIPKPIETSDEFASVLARKTRHVNDALYVVLDREISMS